MSDRRSVRQEPRVGAPALGGGVSLLVLLTLSMQIAMGGEALLVTTGAGSDASRVCLRRMPTEVVRVIRDLVERRRPAGETDHPAVARGEGEGPVGGASVGAVRSGEALGEWLLDLPPPGRG